jgi:hypothetical protein
MNNELKQLGQFWYYFAIKMVKLIELKMSNSLDNHERVFESPACILHHCISSAVLKQPVKVWHFQIISKYYNSIERMMDIEINQHV